MTANRRRTLWRRARPNGPTVSVDQGLFAAGSILVTMATMMLGFVVFGCAAAPKPKEPDISDKILKQVAVLNTPTNEGSIWVEGSSAGLFTDVKARVVGDIVVVQIDESSAARKRAGMKLDRDAGVSGALEGADSVSGLKSLKGKLSLGQNSNSLGEASRSDNVVATVTAFVTEMLPNGNLRIEGRKDVRVDSENQYIYVSGIIRPSDISQTNTVRSTGMADAKIEYSGDGALSDGVRRGWLKRVFDFVWPL
ncbi:MAG: flagellar basal body L-ring protein FlgH [Nitrospirae bacterium]|nr:flagellar basal body L-ring protein FlgH [Nitrospirota bacterium]